MITVFIIQRCRECSFRAHVVALQMLPQMNAFLAQFLSMPHLAALESCMPDSLI